MGVSVLEHTTPLVTDGLVRLFESPALKRLRNGGMRAVAAIAPVRRVLAQSALR